MIVCLRTVSVPAEQRSRYLEWIAEGRSVRVAHGILAELVLEPASGEGDTVVMTVWPSHEVFDADHTGARRRLPPPDVPRRRLSADHRQIAGGYS